MILTTTIKQPCTTTEHNNKSYIFTLYLFMLLCVVGNCLLFYCSCTGNCENCCGINGNASVSGGIKDKSESENENKDIKNLLVKDKDKDNKNRHKENQKEKDKSVEEDNKIDNKNKIDSKNKLEEVKISAEGKIDNIQIVNKEFVNQKLVSAYKYTGSTEKDYKAAKEEFMDKFDTTYETTYETHLSAYVEVEDNGTVKLRCFINCTNANSIGKYSYYGLFEGSEATKIVILSCGSEITNMNGMFCRCSSLTILYLSNFKTNNVTDMSFMFDDCSSLTILDLSNFNTNNVTNMSLMFYYCSGLTKLDLSNFNTDNVTDMSEMFDNCHSLTNIKLSSFNTTNVTNMSYMFSECSSLTELNLSSFNTDTVKDMSYMFNNCFQNNATLICKASTLKKITDENKISYLIITNEKKAVIKKTIENNKNPEQVYTCIVKRGGNEDNPQITEVA